MYTLMRWVLTTSRQWWLVGSLLILNLMSLRLLFALEDRFEAAAGLPVFDTQNDLTPARLMAQLPRYTGAARTAYGWFAAYDWVFPFVAALTVAVVWAWLLRTNPLPIARRLLRWHVPLWAFAITLFDWLENTSLLLIVYGGSAGTGVIQAALIGKRLKLGGLAVSDVLTVLLVTVALRGRLYRVWQSRTLRTPPP